EVSPAQYEYHRSLVLADRAQTENIVVLAITTPTSPLPILDNKLCYQIANTTFSLFLGHRSGKNCYSSLVFLNRVFIPFFAVKFTADGFRPWSSPLLEEECNFMFFTLTMNFSNPLGLYRSKVWAAFPAHYRPRNAF